jgi:HSP20 family molecular chaperone IbpA
MWAEACAVLARAEGLHRQFFQPGFAGTQAATWEPPVDIFETERELWIIAALPGVESQDLAISIEGQVLSVAGLRRLPAEARGAAIHRMEIPYGRFERSIRLPAARLELTRSALESGCLFISLNKRF